MDGEGGRAGRHSRSRVGRQPLLPARGWRQPAPPPPQHRKPHTHVYLKLQERLAEVDDPRQRGARGGAGAGGGRALLSPLRQVAAAGHRRQVGPALRPAARGELEVEEGRVD